ncbi:MAG: HAD-IA family hydrolase [Desulfuromonadaceae bacterium]|nr:HAD-IA family hydrolase [Desulfuromonadaceae bacterium]
MNARAVFFDLDGTLVDSLEDLTDAVNHVREAFSLPLLAVDEVRPKIGKGGRNLMQQVLPDGTDADINHALGLFLEFNRQHIADKSHLYPGIRETLLELASQNIKMAVISNKNEDLSRKILQALGVHDLFEDISGGDTYPERKPSPLPLLNVVQKLGVVQDNCVMVGDSINDIQAAHQANIASIGCSWGYGSREELSGATVFSNSPHELRTAISATLR